MALRTTSRTEEPEGSHARAGLFAAKLRSPAITRGGVVRTRLHRLLDDGVASGMVVVSGPPGAGKTHLVAEWATRQRTPRDLAWVTLDRADRDPARFLRYVTAAVGGTPSGTVAFSGISPLPPLTPPDEAYMVTVADAMSRLAGEVVLVLDDFHEVVGSETEALLRRAVRYPPDKVRVVVLTRVEPDLGQARLHLQGHLCEIGAADLAFTEEETRNLLCSESLTLAEPDLARLQERTEGWVAAVCLAAESMKSSHDVGGFVSALPTGHQRLNDYLLTEVYDGQPPDVQAFLLRACVVDCVCSDLASALTGRPDAERVLAELSRAHLLVDSSDATARWYRWNPMFASLLRSQLHARSGDLERELNSRAATWFHEHGLPVPAVEHALAGGDTETAARVLGECWLDLVVSGESTVLTDLLQLFDGVALARHPEPAVASAFMGVRHDDVEESLRLADQAVRTATDLPPRRRLAIEVMAAVVRLYAATMTGRRGREPNRSTALGLLDTMAEHEAPLTQADRVRRALLLYNLGAFETSTQRYDEARGHLLAALSEAETLDMPYLRLSCLSQLVEVEFQAGELTRAIGHADEVLAVAETRGWSSYHGLTATHVNLAAIALLRDDLEAVQRHLDAAQRILRPADLLNRIRISFLRKTALCAAGQVKEAGQELELLSRYAPGSDLPDWVSLVRGVAAAWQARCEGSSEEALKQIDSVPVEGTDGVASALSRAVVRADLLLRCGRAAEAREVLMPWLERDGRRPQNVAALVLASLAAEDLGRHDEALDALERALGIASPEQMLWPFVSPGPRARALLEELIERGTPYQSLAVEALRHMTPTPRTDRRTSGQGSQYVEPLSERELEVLRHLQGTSTNPEIAAELFISPNTLRTHMKSINRKIGAANRRDAVRRARELGIL